MSFEVEVASDVTPDGRRTSLINATDVSSAELTADPQFREIALQLGRWVDNARARGTQANMFRRDRYVAPDNPYDQMRTARDAVKNDDIVSGVAEITEAIAFPGLKWESESAEEADVFNQLSADLNLDAFIRSMWREEFTTEQAVVAKLWGAETYHVRGRTKNGNKRKKRFDVWVPQRLVVLDSEHVVPVGNGPLRRDRLAWYASDDDTTMFDSAVSGERIDPLMTQFFQGRYDASEAEKQALYDLGVDDPTRLLLLDENWVFRHCSTKSDYEKWPTLRMRSVFGLLDLKQQLISSDRASLIGAANYILLIRKGSKEQPAQAAELSHLRESYNFLAKLPVIISDHRLEIDIIAPKLDFVLKKESYDLLDQRILQRLLGAMAFGRTNEASATTMGGLVAKTMNNRRHMIKRTMEKEIARAVVKHPRNDGLFDTTPSLVYTPRTVAVDSDQAYTSALLALRTQREISRETILEYLNLDQATEAQRMELEEEQYDDIFRTQVPFSATNPAGGANPGGAASGDSTGAPTPNGTPESPKVSGARGGRPVGGGESTQSPTAQTRPRNRNGNATRGQG